MRQKLAPKLALGMFIGLESTALEKEAALQEWIFEREANLTVLTNSPFLLEEVANFLETEADSTSASDRLIWGLAVNTGPVQSFQTLFILSPEYDLYARASKQQIPICFPLNGKWR